MWDSNPRYHKFDTIIFKIITLNRSDNDPNSLIKTK
jgi:hypothetical protein